MHRGRIWFISGIWIALLPFLGFPLAVKNFLIALSGLAIAYVGYLIYRKEKSPEPASYENFSENKDAQ
ncbi:MAG: hypothetical protein AAB500_02465 [Patescibacteria group bacterium]